MQLSHRHDIEPKLYNSDALDKINKLMGDRLKTKWLSHIYDENIEGEVLWKWLFIFLEKDFSIQQQKMNESKSEKRWETTRSSSKIYSLQQ